MTSLMLISNGRFIRSPLRLDSLQALLAAQSSRHTSASTREARKVQGLRDLLQVSCAPWAGPVLVLPCRGAQDAGF